MAGRLLGITSFSLFVGFIIATSGQLFLPSLAVAAGPVVCDGTFRVPSGLDDRFRFACEGAAGEVTSVSPLRVILTTTIIYALLFSPIAALLVQQRSRELNRRLAAIANDRARALQARADILAWPSGHAVLRRLTRQAEVRLLLWVQPPNLRPYEARVVWLLDEQHLPAVHPGAHVAVQVNPVHPERVYPVEEWGELIF